ncbi:TPA: hypothetical protein ACXIEW_002580 [Pseudomonas aeruginosa]
MSAETQLVEVPAKETALQVYSAANGLDPFLAKIREEIDGFVPDVTTRKGREAIASIAYKVARSKTALDNVGKELVVDAKRWRHARDILTVEAIELAQSDFINFGLPPDERESIRADQAIDSAMERTP